MITNLQVLLLELLPVHQQEGADSLVGEVVVPLQSQEVEARTPHHLEVEVVALPQLVTPRLVAVLPLVVLEEEAVERFDLDSQQKKFPQYPRGCGHQLVGCQLEVLLDSH